MISKVIQKKITEGSVILYRRTSTKKQAKDGHQAQLKAVHTKYPRFTIARSTIHDISESISGRVDAERRMCSGLGRCLKKLKRHPHSIMLVSDFDRVARRTDLFDLIVKQGLGDRIYDVAGRTLTEMVGAGDHIAIEKQTEADNAATKAGIKRFQASGGMMGSVEIGKQSQLASKKKSEMAKDCQAAVLAVVRQEVMDSRGAVPSDRELCDRLDEQGLRTGHGRLWTPLRIQQRRKRDREAWDYATDSYSRPRRRLRQMIEEALAESLSVRDSQLSKARPTCDARSKVNRSGAWRRIRFLVTAARIEVRNPREHQRHMKTLLLVTNGGLYFPCLTLPVLPAPNDVPCRLRTQHDKELGCDGCRGPPGYTPAPIWAIMPSHRVS